MLMNFYESLTKEGCLKWNGIPDGEEALRELIDGVDRSRCVSHGVAARLFRILIENDIKSIRDFYQTPNDVILGFKYAGPRYKETLEFGKDVLATEIIKD